MFNTPTSTADFPVVQFFDNAKNGSRSLATLTMLFAAGFVLCCLLHLLDDRLLLGVSVWDKPAKFFLSLGVHFITIAWALSLLEPGQRNARPLKWSVGLMAVAAVLELAVIVARAARGEASHFNTAAPLDAAVYAVMGVGAVTLTFTAAYVGYRVWRLRSGNLMREAAGVGLMLGAVLGTLTAAYMSSQTGHHVGGAVSDAQGLPILRWSTVGGDLRVAHFVGLHAMQVLPLAALSGKRPVVYIAALAMTGLALFTFLQALMGEPLFRTT
jgi:hypothetical protein